MSNDLDLDEIQQPSLIRNPRTVPADFLKPGPVKVVLLGSSSVGKSCIINFVVNGTTVANSTQDTTLGFPMPYGEVRVGTQEGDVILQLWDTCGSERFFSVGSQFMRGSQAVVFVYDITNYDSFVSLFERKEHHRSWLDEFLDHWSEQEKMWLPIVILGNKADLEDDRHIELETEKVKKRLLEESENRELKPFLFWETSALTGDNLKEFSEVLGEQFPSMTEAWQTGSRFDENTAVIIPGADGENGANKNTDQNDCKKC